MSYSYSSLTYPNSSYSIITGINDYNIIVGYYVNPTSNVIVFGASTNASPIASPGGFTYDINAGTFSSFSVPYLSYAVTPTTITYAEGISKNGEIVGYYYNNYDRGSDGFTLINGTYNTVIINGAINTRIYGVNDSGQFVGTYADTTNQSTPNSFLQLGATTITLSDPDSNGYTIATGINNGGEVVGYYGGSIAKHDHNLHGFTYLGGTFTTVDVPGAVITKLTGISNNGDITGNYTDSALNLHGVVISGNQYTTIDASTSGFYPSGVNSSGTIIGDTGFGTASSVACFAKGTRILTDRGEIAVELFAVGDAVTTVDGQTSTITWLGFFRPSPNDWENRPVCVRAHSFGHNLPHRDLFLSPEHAIFIDGMLAPAQFLVTGDSIDRVAMDDVVYYHVMLDHHDVILAEGLPVETYLPDDNFERFDNWTALPVRDLPMTPCAPRITQGSRLQAVIDQLSTRVCV